VGPFSTGETSPEQITRSGVLDSNRDGRDAGGEDIAVHIPAQRRKAGGDDQQMEDDSGDGDSMSGNRGMRESDNG